MSAYLEEQTIYSTLALGWNPPQRRVTCRESLANHRALFGDQIPLAIALHEDVRLTGTACLYLAGLPKGGGELRVGNRRVAVDADREIRRLHFHDDDLALDVAQTRQRLVLAFDMPVIAGVQVIGCKMFRVFISVAVND